LERVVDRLKRSFDEIEVPICPSCHIVMVCLRRTNCHRTRVQLPIVWARHRNTVCCQRLTSKPMGFRPAGNAPAKRLWHLLSGGGTLSPRLVSRRAWASSPAETRANRIAGWPEVKSECLADRYSYKDGDQSCHQLGVAVRWQALGQNARFSP
jgi:hypothetical protein